MCGRILHGATACCAVVLQLAESCDSTRYVESVLRMRALVLDVALALVRKHVPNDFVKHTAEGVEQSVVFAG